jgi:glutathione S-transferase
VYSATKQRKLESHWPKKALSQKYLKSPGEKSSGVRNQNRFLAVSPKGEMPVLIDDGLAIHDSTVINEYLNQRYPEPNLMPDDVTNRTLVRIWEDEADQIMNVAVVVLISEVFVKAEAGDANLIVEAKQNLAGYLERLAQQIGEQEYICGAFSLADISTFVSLVFAQTLGVELSNGPVKAWFDRALPRPAVQAEYQGILGAAAAA